MFDDGLRRWEHRGCMWSSWQRPKRSLEEHHIGLHIGPETLKVIGRLLMYQGYDPGLGRGSLCQTQRFGLQDRIEILNKWSWQQGRVSDRIMLWWDLVRPYKNIGFIPSLVLGPKSRQIPFCRTTDVNLTTSIYYLPVPEGVQSDGRFPISFYFFYSFSTPDRGGWLSWTQGPGPSWFCLQNNVTPVLKTCLVWCRCLLSVNSLCHRCDGEEDTTLLSFMHLLWLPEICGRRDRLPFVLRIKGNET